VRRRRIRHNVDGPQPAIVAALRKAGFSVDVIGDPVDLLVAWPGMNLLMEVKAEKGRLTEAQVEFFRTWKGPKCIVRSVAEALQACGVPA
jgi:hypothetical protein